MEAQKKECSLNGEHGVQPFLSEDREYVTMTAKLAAQWSTSVGLGHTEDILKYSKDWAEFSGKLYKYWVSMGFPKLPDGSVRGNSRLTLQNYLVKILAEIGSFNPDCVTNVEATIALDAFGNPATVKDKAIAEVSAKVTTYPEDTRALHERYRRTFGKPVRTLKWEASNSDQGKVQGEKHERK